MLGAGRLVGAAAGALGLGIASFLGLNQKFHIFVNRQPEQVEAEESETKETHPSTQKPPPTYKLPPIQHLQLTQNTPLA